MKTNNFNGVRHRWQSWWHGDDDVGDDDADGDDDVGDDDADGDDDDNDDIQKICILTICRH